MKTLEFFLQGGISVYHDHCFPSKSEDLTVSVFDLPFCLSVSIVHAFCFYCFYNVLLKVCFDGYDCLLPCGPQVR